MPSFADLMALKEKGAPQYGAPPGPGGLPPLPTPAWQTPGIGDGIPGNLRMDGSVVPTQSKGMPDSIWQQALGMNRPAMPRILESQSVDSSPLPPALRQDFDTKGEYDKIMAQMQPAKHKFNFWDALSIAGPALQAFGGDLAGADASIARMDQARRDHEEQVRSVALQALKWKYDRFRQGQEWLGDAAKPRTVGRNIVQLDTQTGQPHVLYNSPADFEDYATAQNLQPGTPQYFNAVQDYVLRANGPTALSNDKAIDDYRTGNREQLERVRQANRDTLELQRQRNRLTLRGSPSYRDTHPTVRGAGGTAQPTATGPNGQKMVFNGKAWVPVQ